MPDGRISSARVYTALVSASILPLFFIPLTDQGKCATGTMKKLQTHMSSQHYLFSPKTRRKKVNVVGSSTRIPSLPAITSLPTVPKATKKRPCDSANSAPAAIPESTRAPQASSLHPPIVLHSISNVSPVRFLLLEEIGERTCCYRPQSRPAHCTRP